MSYQQFQQECGDCHKRWNASFGIVGTTQIAAPPTKCPHCGSGNLIKIADRWADRQPLSVTAYCQGCADSERTIADLREQKNAIGAAISEIHSMLVKHPMETGDARTFRETLHEIRVAAEQFNAVCSERDELRSQNAALQDKLDVLCEPGTPIAIVKAMFDFAIAECGHQRHSSRHAMTTIRETIKALRERNAELEREAKFNKEDATRNLECAQALQRSRDHALSELAEARSFQINFEHATKIEREEAQKDTERLDWLECHEIPIGSPCPDGTFGVGETAKFPWGAARLEEEIPNGLRWAKLDWREAIDAARAAIPADDLASSSNALASSKEDGDQAVPFQGGRD